MMKKIYAITGGIGSGKSTVSRILSDNGFSVLSADEVYGELIKNKDFSREIYNELGMSFDEKKGFDRKEVSAKAFQDKLLMKKLNDFTHEKVMQKMFLESENLNGIVFHEVPLLFESGFENRYDGVIVVLRNLNARIKAVAERDGLSSEQILLRMKNQYDYEKIDRTAHTVIENDGDYSTLERKVMAVVSEIKKSII